MYGSPQQKLAAFLPITSTRQNDMAEACVYLLEQPGDKLDGLLMMKPHRW